MHSEAETWTKAILHRSETDDTEEWSVRWQSTRTLMCEKGRRNQGCPQFSGRSENHPHRWCHLTALTTHTGAWPAAVFKRDFSILRRGVTYAEADCEGFMDVDPQSPAWWGTFGDAGRDESVSSSMSEWEEGGLVDFFFPKACLNELLSWKEERNDPSCLCACGEFGFGALVCRCYPSHCLGSVRTSRVLTGAARYL